MIHTLVQLAYIVATALFIFSLHWMSDPKTARKGVISGVAGMSLAVIATWAQPGVGHHLWIVLAIIAVIHDLVAAARWATRMLVMDEGRIVDDGPPQRVMMGGPLGRAFGVSISEARAANGSGSTWRFERRSGA